MATTFNVLDLIFMACSVMFVAIAFIRGFVKEMFALSAWLLSFLLSYFLAPFAAKLLSSYSENGLVLQIVCRVIIFFISFAIFIVSTSSLCNDLQEKVSHAIDRSLGILYGLLKTLIVFGFIYAIAVNILTIAGGSRFHGKKNLKEELPEWLINAKCYNLIKISGDVINPVVSRFVSGISKDFEGQIPQLPEKTEDKTEDKNQKNEKPSEDLDSSKEALKKIVNEDDSGYTKKDIEKMKHLIEVIDK